MIRYLILALFAFTAPANAQTTHSTRDLDSNHDGKVVLTKARGPFVRGDVLVICAGFPAFTYAMTCPIASLPVRSEPDAPVITTPFEAGKSTASALRRTNLHIGRVLDGYVLNGDGIGIGDVRINLARYGLTMRRKDGSYGTATNLGLSRVDITASEAAFAIRGGSHDITISDARLTCSGTSPGIPAGVKVGAANSLPNYNITIQRAVITSCVSKDRKGYMQGDGIATERPDHHITIADTISTDHGDGCLDLKSSATRLDNVTVARCNFGLRLWAQGTAGTVTIGAVRKAAIQMKPSTNWTINNLVLTAPALAADIVTDGGGGTLTIARCSRPVTLRITKGTTVNLGQGCKTP